MKKIITCITIDDEPPALTLLKEYIFRFSFLQLSEQFNDAIAGQQYLKQHPVDLLFVDINMPDLSGIELVKNLSFKPMVIFTTAHKKFALEGFELDAIDYLLKPINFERFEKAVNKASEYFEYKTRSVSEKPDSIFVYSEYRMVKIELQNITHIESLEDYVRIYLLDEKPILTLMTLKKTLDKLPSDQFRRIHRSYIVAVNKVKAIHNRKLTLVNNAEIPVSESYLDFISYWKEKNSGNN